MQRPAGVFLIVGDTILIIERSCYRDEKPAIPNYNKAHASQKQIGGPEGPPIVSSNESRD
jgi:hypothetical protein